MICEPTGKYSSDLLQIKVVVCHENQRNRAELEIEHRPAESDPKREKEHDRLCEEQI